MRSLGVLLILLLAQLAPVRAQQMPRPVVLPDPGARCPGFLPCPTIDRWAVTLRVDPWYATQAPPQRDQAGGVRADLSLDMGRIIEGGISAGMLAWSLPGPASSHIAAWNLLSAHARGVLPLGDVSLVGSYEHIWDLDHGAGAGLLLPGQTTGHGTAGIHVAVLHQALTLGLVTGLVYAPTSGAAAAELGIRASVTPPDPQHHVTFWLEGQMRRGVRGDAGAAGYWAGAGFASLNSDTGGEMGGGILLGSGAEVPPILFVFRLAGHFGQGYRPPNFAMGPGDDGEDDLLAALARRRGHPPQRVPAAPQILLGGALAQRPQRLPDPWSPATAAAGAPGASGAPGPGPSAWYPQGPAAGDLSTITQVGKSAPPATRPPPWALLQRPAPRQVWGQAARPPRMERPPPEPAPARARTPEGEWKEEREREKEALQETIAERIERMRREAERHQSPLPGPDEPEIDPPSEGPVLRPARGASLSSGAQVPYHRPPSATSPRQRASVQGKPCVNCGRIEPKMVADHKTPLVVEHYTEGEVNRERMHEVDAVQPQCPTCSARQGAQMSRYSREMKAALHAPPLPAIPTVKP